jgi:integrase
MNIYMHWPLLSRLDGTGTDKHASYPEPFAASLIPTAYFTTSKGNLSPHDLRRTAITRALESGLTYRQVQMMSKHRDPKTVMRYDRGRENMEQNAVNFIKYEEELFS